MIAEALTALTSQVESEVHGLHGYDHVPEQIAAPAFIVSLGSGTYDDDFDGALAFDVSVLILVSDAPGAKRTQAAFQSYLDPTGDASVAAAIHALPASTADIDFARVTGWADPQTFEIGGISYSGVELSVELIVSP